MLISDWSSDVCSSDLYRWPWTRGSSPRVTMRQLHRERREAAQLGDDLDREVDRLGALLQGFGHRLDVVRLIVQRLGGFLKVVDDQPQVDRKSTRLNSSH